MKILTMIAILMMMLGCSTGEDYYYSESYTTPTYYPSYYYPFNNAAFYDFSFGLDTPFYSSPYLYSGSTLYNNYYYSSGYHHWNGWGGGHHHH